MQKSLYLKVFLEFTGFLKAESVGFEPTCPGWDNRISSAARYDHFDNSPELIACGIYSFFCLSSRKNCFISPLHSSSRTPRRTET